jgi:diacylglycerol kinase (ATP)
VRRVALLANPAAGHGRAPRLAAAARDRFAELGIEVHDLLPGSAAQAQTLAEQAVADGVDALVVVGGDGMIHLALAAVVGSSTHLGAIPAGTGNDQARAHGWPRKSVAEAVEVIAAGHTRRIDVGTIETADGNRTLFGSVLAAGFDSLVSDRTNRMTWPHGRARYNLAILAEFVNLRPLPMRVSLDDGTVIDDDMLLVAVGNTSTYGGGMRICPDADPTDGLLDVTIGRAASRRKVLMQLPAVYRGTHVRRPEVQTFRTRSLVIDAEGINAYADGEYIAPLPVRVGLMPGALTVLVPAAGSR